ncbi:MAG: OB-fold nucleic acid binding domain-containing protein, partial [Pseudomonadales bacterium]|nr:OB-fold nucleic acid binding domain-containing protein [Pseudomonadales bacterium]
SIVYGLGAIKGLGEGPIEAIVRARDSGCYEDLYDFCERLDQRKVNKRAIEALIGSGALDNLVEQVPAGTQDAIGYRRALLIANQNDAVGLAEQKARNEDSGLTDLFGSDVLVSETAESRYNHFDQLKCLSFRDRLNREKESLGLFLSGHLVDEYREEFRHFIDSRISDMRSGLEDHTVGGLIVGMRMMKSRRGEAIAFVTLDDKSGRAEVSVFGDVFDQVREKLEKDEIIFVRGSTAEDDFNGGIRMCANEVFLIAEARSRRASNLCLELNSSHLYDGFVDELAEFLKPYRQHDAAGCPVAINIVNSASSGNVILGDEWRISPHDDLLHSLREHYGKEKVRLLYP